MKKRKTQRSPGNRKQIELQAPSFENLAKIKDKTIIGPFRELYAHMRTRLGKVKKSIDTMSTYPTQPGRGENKERDEYFEKCHHIVVNKPKIQLRRMVTITHLSKYRWVKEMIETLKDCDNFNLGYLDMAKYNLPFIGIILLDKREIFITAVTFPLDQALYIWSNETSICEFFSSYMDRTWSDCCIKLKEDKQIYEKNLRFLDVGLTRPQINEVDLHSTPPPQVRVAVAQISLNSVLQEKDGLLQATASKAKKMVLDYCKSAVANKANLLVLPELCMLKELIGPLKQIADKDNIVIVGGTYYDSKKKNVAPILIPGKQTLFTEKTTLSPYECSPLLGHSATPGEVIHIVRNSPCGSFGVLICSDYLEKTIVDEIYDKKVDFLCVVSLNASSRKFAVDMSRDCEISGEGVYIIYANAVFKWQGRLLGDGNTAIFGFMDRVFLEKLDKREESLRYQIKALGNRKGGLLLADFNINDKRPRYLSVHSRPNISNIESTSL